jgi:serine/threonine protein kinase
VGKTLVDDRYELRALAGGGGMADVFLAYDRVLDRDVALKLL